MGAVCHSSEGRQQRKICGLTCNSMGSGKGPDISPFSPRLFVGGHQRARPPVELNCFNPIPLLLLDHCPGPQLCMLGGAGAMLGETQQSQPRLNLGRNQNPNTGERHWLGGKGMRAKVWPCRIRTSECPGTKQFWSQGSPWLTSCPILSAHLSLTSGVQITCFDCGVCTMPTAG